MKTNYELIQEFHAKFDPDAGQYADFLGQRMAFLREEVRETLEAAEEVKAATPAQMREAQAHLVKELVDVLQGAYGTLHLMGVDVNAAFAEVHASNMSKTPNHGGKAIKGEGYRTAQMEQFVQ